MVNKNEDKMRLKSLLFLVVGAIWLSMVVCAHAADGTGEAIPFQQGITTGAAAPIAPLQQFPGAMQPQGGAAAVSSPGEYVLGVGDRFRMTVYGEDDLSGEYEVGSTGVAALPLIGNVQAAGLTVRDFEQAVRSKLAAGYLHDPRVSVQVSNYRPFFILGEVSKPGGYPYVNGMTVLNAVALAGGYTYRADKSGVIIVRANDPNKTEVPIGEDGIVQPGDIIRIPERFF